MIVPKIVLLESTTKNQICIVSRVFDAIYGLPGLSLRTSSNDYPFTNRYISLAPKDGTNVNFNHFFMKKSVVISVLPIKK